MDEKDQVDTCCRSLYKCDAYKRIAFNLTNDALWNIQPCDCIHLFQICLDNLNTSLSSEVDLLHSMNTTKCYINDYPIVQCAKWELYPDSDTPFLRFVNQAEREKFHNRCSKYELDGNRPKQLQLRDLPFNHHAMPANQSQQTFNLEKSEFVPPSWQILNDFLPKMFNLFLYSAENRAFFILNKMIAIFRVDLSLIEWKNTKFSKKFLHLGMIIMIIPLYRNFGHVFIFYSSLNIDTFFK